MKHCAHKLGGIVVIIATASIVGCEAEGCEAEGEAADTGMVVIPSAEAWVGCDSTTEEACTLHESPRFQVNAPSFHIDSFEVSVAEYVVFLNAQGNLCGDTECAEAYFDHSPVQNEGALWSAKAGRDTHPMSAVSWYGADAYCRYVGKRLCSEVEWEIAALGVCEHGNCAQEKTRYPWGNADASCAFAHMVGDDKGCGTDSLAPVGSYPAGVSPFGVYDMAGNAWEWVADTWREDYAEAESTTQAWVDEAVPFRVVRGGGFGSGPERVRGSHRFNAGATDKSADYGFRCCR